MSKNSENVSRWRANTKRKLISAFGDKCCLCGYNKCDKVLEFHHLDPSIKDFGWGEINGNIKSWSKIITEIKKCVCLCSNCHKEVHAGVSTVPDTAPRFDELLIPSHLFRSSAVYDSCPICGKLKYQTFKTCSRKCSYNNTKRIVDWSTNDVVELLMKYKTYAAVGELLGVTGAAVSRRHKQVTKIQTQVP